MKGKRRKKGGPRDRVGFRLGDNERDRYLAEQLDQARGRGVNVSDLIKELLYAYFTGELDQFNNPGQQRATEAIDRRVEAATAKLLGLTFKDVGGGNG